MPDVGQRPAYASLYPAEMPEGAPEPGTVDWLWFHPGKTRKQYQPTYLHHCQKCDVLHLHLEWNNPGKPRCWNCGRYIAKYKLK